MDADPLTRKKYLALKGNIIERKRTCIGFKNTELIKEEVLCASERKNTLAFVEIY